VEIGPDAITTPYANTRDVAVLQASVNGPPISALPMVFDQIRAGTLFVIAGLRPDGSRAFVAQHVRFCATRTVIGDSATAELAGCQGAPAIGEQGVFGIVSECGPDRVPEITPLAVSRSFLRRAVPETAAPSSEMSKFRVEEREVIGSGPEVGIGDVREGELDVPLYLGEREALVAATARFVTPPPVTQADLTVLSFHDRGVRLRFTLGGPPVPAIDSSAWPAAEALVVVRLKVVVVPKF
jgi:hypothetical protein